MPCVEQRDRNSSAEDRIPAEQNGRGGATSITGWGSGCGGRDFDVTFGVKDQVESGGWEGMPIAHGVDEDDDDDGDGRDKDAANANLRNTPSMREDDDEDDNGDGTATRTDADDASRISQEKENAHKNEDARKWKRENMLLF